MPKCQEWNGEKNGERYWGSWCKIWRVPLQQLLPFSHFFIVTLCSVHPFPHFMILPLSIGPAPRHSQYTCPEHQTWVAEWLMHLHLCVSHGVMGLKQKTPCSIRGQVNVSANLRFLCQFVSFGMPFVSIPLLSHDVVAMTAHSAVYINVQLNTLYDSPFVHWIWAVSFWYTCPEHQAH